MSIQSIAVFCGSKPGNNPLFETHTKALGYLLAQKNITLIYGGGNVGLMSVIANACLEKNGKVTGIIPKILVEREQQHLGITELIITENMHSRKQLLYEKCDAALVLPGGYGTLDEVFEMLTWNQLKIHDKKIFFMNSGGFYNHLLEHIHAMEQEGFLYDHPDKKMTALNEPSDILKYI